MFDMKSLMNKKADVTITTVILIVLGLVVLVMLIIGFTKGTGFFFDIFDKGPGELQSLAKACEGYVAAGLSIDFCTYRLIDVSGDDELVNCNDQRIKPSLTAAGVTLPSNFLTCSMDSQNQIEACRKISSGKRSSVKVDGVACDNILGSSPLACRGSVTPCTDAQFSTPELCNAQKGCSYAGGACSGTSTSCTDAQFSTPELCNAQKGCVWER
jgi:hypothetical protein